MQQKARAFLAFAASEEYPHKLPEGREIAPSMRHLTLVFFPEVDLKGLIGALDKLSPLPQLGFGGIAKEFVLLPPRHPRVLAWNVNLGPSLPVIARLAETYGIWAEREGFLQQRETRAYLPHVSLMRSPFSHLDRIKTVYPHPILFPSLHLYESVGNLEYEKRWSKELIVPYREIPHTADVAFEIVGRSLEELYWNASLALATRWEQLLPSEIPVLESHPDLIRMLNKRIAEIDSAEGISLKAVSYHSTLTKREDVTYWEMIVDV